MGDLFEIVDGKVIVTTSTGWRVECLPYGDDLMRAGTALMFPEKPQPPTYDMAVEGVDLEPIRVPYTHESIDDEKTPAEDTEAWGVYLLELQTYNQETAAITAQQSLMRARVMVHRATTILDAPDLTAWAQERVEYYGIPVPDAEKDVLFQFYTSEVSKSQEDVLKIMAGIMRATGVAEEVLDQFESNFRDTLGRTEGEDDSPDPQAVAEPTEDAKAGMVDGATVEPA